MTTRIARAIAATALVVILHAADAAAKPPSETGPVVPPEIAVPDGHVPFVEGRAVGTQNYICLAINGAQSWRFIGPQATVFFVFNGGLYQQTMTHFLSANPVESGLPRPTWQHSADSSRVWGRAAASSTDPAFVEAGAIPWLLVAVTGSARGPAGGGLLVRASFIHRVNTSGGAPPTSGCTQPADVGSTALVPYVADYVFYRPVTVQRDAMDPPAR